ncbi:MAG: manganese efflux pump [Eubacteriaceae bacterium]|nr:manganese efflux pump [Eubacteriaceae bacterium]
MGFWGILILAIGLAMDSSAISACKGMAMRRFNIKHAVVIALSFGFAEGALSFLGWALGSQFYEIFSSYNRWIVLILLSFIGGKMIWDAFHEDPEAEQPQDRFNAKETFILSIVTSVDAMAAGVSFAFMAVNIPLAIGTIAVISSSFSFVSVMIGHYFSAKFGSKAEILGGVALIVIGVYLFASDSGLIQNVL